MVSSVKLTGMGVQIHLVLLVMYHCFIIYESHHEKPCLLGCQLGPTQTGCIAVQDGKRLEIFYLGSRGSVLSM